MTDEEQDGTGRAAWWTFVLLLAVGLLFAPGYVDNVDARVCMRSADALLDHGTFALVEPSPDELTFLWTAMGSDGTVWSKFGDGAALILLPFVLLGRLLGLVLPGDPRQAQEFVVSLSSSFYLAVAGSVLVRIAARLGLPARSAVVGVVAFALGTYQLVYAGSTYRETPLVLCFVLAVWCGLRARAATSRTEERRWALGLGAVLGVALLVKSAVVVAFPGLLLPLASSDVRATLRRALWAGLPAALAVGWVLLTNSLRFGGPFESGYVSEEDLFSTPLLDGLGAFLFDPDQSLPLFAPALVLALGGWRALWRRDRSVLLGGVAALLALALLHARFFAYHGGTAYGPRYLLPGAVLLTALPLAAWHAELQERGRRLLLVAITACVLWQLPQALVAPSEYHTLRGHLRSRQVDRALLAPHLVTHLRIARADLAGHRASIPWPLLGLDSETAPGDVYHVPKIEQGPALWWWLAAHERGRFHYALGVLLAVGAAVATVRLRRV